MPVPARLTLVAELLVADALVVARVLSGEKPVYPVKVG